METTIFRFAAAPKSTIFTPVARTPMNFNVGHFPIISSEITVLLVNTASAPCIRSAVSVGDVLAYTVSSPSLLNSSQLKSPGFSV